jgi:aryl-alcohol dehydrogenase-like predicted oxidoreductase
MQARARRPAPLDRPRRRGSARKITKARGTARQLGLSRFASLQGGYTVAGRDLKRAPVPMLASEGLGLMACSPLAGGADHRAEAARARQQAQDQGERAAARRPACAGRAGRQGAAGRAGCAGAGDVRPAAQARAPRGNDQRSLDRVGVIAAPNRLSRIQGAPRPDP